MKAAAGLTVGRPTPQMSVSFFFDESAQLQPGDVPLHDAPSPPRVRDRPTALSKILLTCYPKDRLASLQRRLGVLLALDQHRPASAYRFYLCKRTDVEAIKVNRSASFNAP